LSGSIFQHDLLYGTNINIAQYRNGVRYTLNGPGRVYARTLQQHLAVSLAELS
jgi:hypothetical protein